MYTCKRLVGCQAAIAGKPGSHSWTVYICERWVGCQGQKIAAFGSSEGRAYQSANQPFSQYRTLSPRSM